MVLVLLAGLAWRFSVFTGHATVRDLQQAPLHRRMQLVGMVTYIDEPGRRFWIEDETGATPIPVDPAELNLRVGNTVRVQATKTARYDPARGPASVGLADIRVASSTARIKLPAPSGVSVQQFPSADKNGIEVVVPGVVRGVMTDAAQRTQLAIAVDGNEIEVTVPGRPQAYESLINAQVDVLGLPESTIDPKTGYAHRNVWVASREGVRVVQAAPPSRLYDLRSLYLDSSAKAGHLVRVEGTVTERSDGSLLLEDRWGTIDCGFENLPPVALGSHVEVEGFPTWDGLRIGLVRSRVRVLPSLRAADELPHLPSVDTVRAIRELAPARAAMALPVHLHGVLTYVDPIWRQLYIQDQTGGIYVKYAGHPAIRAGMRVRLTGLTNAGNFAPIVVAPRLSLEGRGELPAPLPADPAKAAAGLLDAQLVRIEGVVHPIRRDDNPEHPVLTFELVSDLGQVHVFTSPGFPDMRQALRFEDARVCIRGVLGSLFNNRRQLIGYQLLVDSAQQIEMLEPASADLFQLEPTPIAELLRFTPHTHYGHRVKVEGDVTLVGHDVLYVQDSTSGVEMRGDTSAIHEGDRIEAVGYPTMIGHYSPVMTDATFRVVGHAARIAEKETTAEAILNGQDDSTLVTLPGRLVAVLNDASRVTLVLQSGVRTFTAQMDTSELGDDLGQLRLGSVLQLRGICVKQLDPNKLYTVLEHDPTNFELLLRSKQDVTVVKAAPFWTLRTTLMLLGAVTLLIPSILIWVAVLRHRVYMQTEALRKAADTAQAMRDLSASMQNVAREQRFDRRVSVRGSEEVAQLVVGFNQMLSELQRSDEARRVAETKLQHMAMVDELTGLPNRRMLFQRLNHSLAEARRDRSMLALLYIDLDGFKLVNDNLGHNIGDLLLQQVAERLRTRARATDTVARIGGDEFILILDRIHAPSDAQTVAGNLLEALETPFEVEGHPIRIGASVGISLYPDHAAESGQLLQQADCAMYAAKHNGKSQIVHFGDELGNAARERLTLESELRRAVAEGCIDVHYQPEFDLATYTIVRFEALARWESPLLGSISPLHFIPIAEESGLIYPLGTHILEQACRDAVQWNALAGRPIPVAVNVSSVQFARASFIDEVAAILKKTGLAPSLLQIELTESAALGGVERASAAMHRLKALGITLAVDDFGTGYSCLSYLPRLPFDALKIDRSFVTELMAHPESGAFLESILTMAHNLKMRVIVEGIETEKELRAVVLLGADEAQGFLLGRPQASALLHLGLAPAEAEEYKPIAAD